MTYNKIKFNNFKVHIIIWALYILYELIVMGLMNTFSKNFPVYTTYYGINILLFYVHSFFFLKAISIENKGKRIFYSSLTILSELIVYITISYLSSYIFFKTGYMKSLAPVTDFSYLSAAFWRFSYFMGFSTGYVFILKSFENQKRNQALEKQNLQNTIDRQNLENELIKTQNNYLRSQINPHFLFNTLGFIYNSTRKKAPEAAEAIISLSEMMRFALKQSDGSETILLESEIEQVENLIKLHALRNNGQVFVEIHREGNLSSQKLMPLVLLTITENIFKHGVINIESKPAKIEVIKQDHKLILRTSNMINDAARSESNHVGIENITSRLKSFYKNVSIRNERLPNNWFLFEIEIDLS